MDRFSNLPIELLPNILDHLIRPSHLASVCLVNSSFHAFGVPNLYRRTFIYAWHREGKVKVVQLFRTLASCPHLAKYVEQLTIRDFPRVFALGKREEILTFCLEAVRNCINLRSCTWTRDGSLSSDIIQALQDLPHLTELEINGHSGRFYKPGLLPDFKHLRRISLIMPSNEVLSILPIWVRETGSTLRYLSLICKSSTVVNDELLESIAEHAVNLEHLYLVGCPKVTHEGLWAIVSRTQLGLKGLGLEGVSPTFDIARFSELCAASNALRHLRSITLTIETRTAGGRHTWTHDIVDLLAHSPLEFFHVSSLGGELSAGGLDDQFCQDIVSMHGARLRRFSVHRLRMSLDAVRDVCERCPNLEQLFVVMDRGDLDELPSCLAFAKNLRAVHVNRPMGPESDSLNAPVVPKEHVLSIVQQSDNPLLRQIGFNTRVHQIERVARRDDSGEVELELRLGPYDSPEIPEQFLVVRT